MPKGIYKRKSKFNITKDFLYKEYIILKKSCIQIANQIGCDSTTILNYLKLYDIPRRNSSEHLKGKTGVNANHYTDGRTNKKHFCIDCGKEIWLYSKRCETCASIKRFEVKSNHPRYINGETLKPHYCIDCGNKVSYGTWYRAQGNPRCDDCYREFNKGKNHWNWKDGISFKPYPIAWTKILKESIRQRDEYTCQICGKTTEEKGRKLDVHHIDYIKANLNPENLISLCKSCHMKTNGNRETYIEFFRILIKEDIACQV